MDPRGSRVPDDGVGARRFYPRYFPQALREPFEIVFCDLRQWAPTPDGFDIDTITLDPFSEDVEAIRQATALDRPIVAGQSQHGTLALAYAQRCPDRVRGVLAIAAGPPAGSDDGLESSEGFFQRDADADRLAAHQRNLATRPVPESVENMSDFVDSYVAGGATGWYDPTFDSSPLWEGVEMNLEVEDLVFEPEILGGFRVDTLDVPVFLALDRYDYGIPYYVWDEPRKSLSDLRYKLYERSGHRPPYEQAGRVHRRRRGVVQDLVTG